jgi:hypothetical protein
MSASKVDIDRVAATGLSWAYAQLALGLHEGRKLEGATPEVGALEQAPAVVEREAFTAFAQAIRTAREAARGEESGAAGDDAPAATIGEGGSVMYGIYKDGQRIAKADYFSIEDNGVLVTRRDKYDIVRLAFAPGTWDMVAWEGDLA